MHLNIKWGKERTSFTIEDPSLPISVLKNYVSQWSHLPLESIKLIHSGAVLRNDNAPLASYRFRPNATIQVVGSAETIPVPPQGSAQKSETTIMTQIQEQLTLVRSSLVPSLEKFLQTLPTQSNMDIPFDSTSNSPTSPASIHKEHARLSEMLLQSLLTLDAITVDGEWVQARQERKAAVREVQGYLDQLDAAWNSRVR
ncbi:BAG domain-containing protein [Lentinula edodes]|uniref:BAG domain-containing protein n=1 Tax=Lentinula lateritia TaxID=40482 RepID=A0A9W9A9N4_9AGAR|nr:BAG domain-containing protein [Lentinula edodes]